MVSADPEQVASPEQPHTYFLVRWLFLRLVSLCYLFAFASLGTQVKGLLGSRGILPAQDLLEAATAALAGARFLAFPTLAWINCSDAFLEFLCWGGAGLAVLAAVGLLVRPCLVLMWIFYLSLVTIGREFMSFQWDTLLVETGFLAMFLSCGQVVAPPFKAPDKLSKEAPPPLAVLLLLRLLLFRLVFFSGLVKLASGDPTYRNLTAVSYHWHTQPLPTPIAWYVAQLPMWCQKFAAIGMFAIELGAPFLLFAPRKARIVAALAIFILQVLIAATGNYTFFNLLTMALCLTALDDRALARILPRRLRSILEATPKKEVLSARSKVAVTAVTVVILLLVSVQFLETATGARPRDSAASALIELVEPLHLVNSYGVFAVMTTRRMEIVVEGSDDGKNWRPYEFKFKPGDLRRAPPWVAPHQPRLDWQMWFAALGSFQMNPWFVAFVGRLMEGSPDVLALLASDPFAGHPPRMMRAIGYDYDFTNMDERQASGNWWRRNAREVYFPEVTRRDGPAGP